MFFFLTRTLVSAAIIVAVTEIAKRNVAIGALTASLPLVSVLSMIWLWRDTGDTARIASYSGETFWYVLPSLPMFLLIPVMLRARLSFWVCLALATVVTALLYLATRALLARFGFSL